MSSSQAAAIQADCCQVLLGSNKMVDKIDLSLEKMKTKKKCWREGNVC